MATKNLTQLREAYLGKATRKITKEWKKMGITVPADVELSCGFPGGGSPRRRIGECWPRDRSGKKVNQIFINPTQSDTLRVLDILGHELLHAADDCQSGHGVGFTKLSKAVGYTGGKASHATGPALTFLAKVAKALGPYPHGELVLVQKKQPTSNGLHKFYCEEHGDVLYSTSKMVGEFGVPVCRECGEEMTPHERGKKKEVKTI